MEKEMDDSRSDPICLYDALYAIKEQQDQLQGSPTSCYSSLFKKLFRIDTIPFILYSKSGAFELAGLKYRNTKDDHDHFITNFFRVEHLDKINGATLSLLRPILLCQTKKYDICHVDRLERTNICVTVDLSYFCAIQCLDLTLLKEIVIEPKW
ncbi:CotY/CotZ family spore coat protein [Metabacillus sp. HB246100]